MNKTNSNLIEPSSVLWKILKIIFWILIVLVAIIAILLFALLGAIACSNRDFWNEKLNSVSIFGKYYQGSLVACVLLAIIILYSICVIIIGSIGVTKPHIGCLYVDLSLVLLGAIVKIINIIFCLNRFDYSILLEFLFIPIFFLMIREIKSANRVQTLPRNFYHVKDLFSFNPSN